ncbi:MAG TPA: 3-deoxy-D-manno-octulosonic acid transferase [Methylomirabilota bacterium]|nr:3-deoxy-D-manno-octulosonic acid transferase [Methylomirabilota bacterium]
MTYPLYTGVLIALLMLYAPAALARRVVRGVPLNVRERLGRGAAAPSPAPCAWIHAVSVGEAIAAAPLVEGLRRAYPDLSIVISTVTETGARVVRQRYAGVARHRYFPLDLPGAARRVTASINPAFFIAMETELWPNLLRVLASRGVPAMIANGRLSDRSFRRYRLARRAMRRVLADVRVFAMQSAEDARRIIALGASPERVMVTGNLKNESPPDPAGAADLWQRLLGLRRGQRVWIAGSTHRGEEEAVFEAHGALLGEFGDLALVVAPRHPERVAEVEALAAARGWRTIRRSELPASRAAGDGPSAVIVLDTVGELAQLYSVANAVFVGGSMVPSGGHNMLEPALRRKPVLFGPHTQNFRESAGLLVESGAAIVVRDATELAAGLRRLLGNPPVAAALGEAGYEAVAARHGSVRETLDLVARFLRPGAGA